MDLGTSNSSPGMCDTRNIAMATNKEGSIRRARIGTDFAESRFSDQVSDG